MTTEPILEIRHLEKIFDNGVRALKDVSLKLYQGEFLGVIGLSGSGKSSLFRCINRLIEPTYGEILYRGKDVRLLEGRALREYRCKVGMIFQHFNLIQRKPVITNVLSGCLGRVSTGASLFGMFSREDRNRAMEYLKIVGLEDKAYVRADELSGGQQQRVAIARSLMQDAEILLADEPVASLDPATSHSIMKYLEQAHKELGKTIICNLHFLSLVRQYTSRVIALKGGEIVFEGRPEEIDESWFKQIYGDEAASVEIR